MKKTIKFCAAAAGVIVSAQAFALSPTARVNQEIRRINFETQRLQREVRQLKAQVRHLKQQNHSYQQSSQTMPPLPQPKRPAKESVNVNLASFSPISARRRRAANMSYAALPDVFANEPGEPVYSPPQSLYNPYLYSPQKHKQIRRAVINYIRGVTVTTSPLLGLRSAYSPADLLYQQPSMNEDLLLIRRRAEFAHLVEAQGGKFDSPMVVISGGIEGQVINAWNYAGRSNSDINLSTAELDIWAVISKWANGFMSLDYDSSAPETGSRVTNSRIYLSRGFLTIGNLDEFPVYFTLGQLYAPFGKFSSAMLTTPLTKSIARIEARAAVLGFFRKGLYMQLYGFQGNNTRRQNRLFRQGGFNIGYENGATKIGSIDLGAGIVSNIADSEGMQSNGAAFAAATPGSMINTTGQFAGFGNTTNGFSGAAGDALRHSVPAVDAHAEVSYGHWTFLSEFIAATRRFDTADVTYNNRGALIKVMHAEVDYNWNWDAKPFTLGFAYGQTWQSLAFNLPKNSYAMVLSTSLWKDTVEGIEYRHDVNYSVQSIGSVGGAGLAVPASNIGGTRNLITLQFGVYF